MVRARLVAGLIAVMAVFAVVGCTQCPDGDDVWERRTPASGTFALIPRQSTTDLARNADLVVEGTVGASTVEDVPYWEDSKFFLTEIHVDRVYRGQAEGTIEVLLPLSRWSAREDDPPVLVEGSRYLLFLRDSVNYGPSVYGSVANEQGRFAIVDDCVVGEPPWSGNDMPLRRMERIVLDAPPG